MNKREQVINCARKLFTKYGYKRVSMDEIARESGVTKKTIYTYFADKSALFQYFIMEELDNMKNSIETERKKNITFLELVSSSVYKMLLYRKESIFISNLYNDFKDDELLMRQFSKIYDDEIIKYIEDRIDEAIKNNKIKKCNSHLTAFIIYKVYISVIFEYDEEIDEDKVTKEITSILKNGLLI